MERISARVSAGEEAGLRAVVLDDQGRVDAGAGGDPPDRRGLEPVLAELGLRGAEDALGAGRALGMRVICIEEHWTTPEIDRAVRAAGHDPSVALNDHGDLAARLLDVGDGRIEAMDAAGVDIQVLSLAPPGTNGLAAADATALSRDANDRAAAAAAAHPGRLRALASLPMADPAVAVAELERVAGMDAHVGVMTDGRCGDRPLDDPAYDDVLATAAAHGLPVFLHPQVPPQGVREASFGGLGPAVGLGLATFGWGWHVEAGQAALRLVVSGALDRHPGLQLVLGHWGELLLFALERADALSAVATHLERRVSEYVATNVHVTTSGMFAPRLLRAALDVVGPDRILLSGDHPFHRLGSTDVDRFLGLLPDPADRERVAHGNAEALFSGAGG